jgi:diguanylate cyclase (GGDEF)-like protein
VSTLPVTTLVIAALSTLIMAFGIFVLAGRLPGSKLIRDVAYATALVGAGMLVYASNAGIRYPLLRNAGLASFTTYAAWASVAVRMRVTGKPLTQLGQAIAAFGMVAACWGYFDVAHRHYAEAASYCIIAAAWLSCLPAAFSEKQPHLRNGAYLTGASAAIDICCKLYCAFICVTASAAAPEELRFGSTFILSFWLVLLGSLGAVMYVFNDMHSKSENRAQRDPLTAALNRRGLDAHVASLAMYKPGGRVGVIALDIDNFKKINDVFGHGCGDRVLEACANRLRQALRENDVLARVGGEEFLILLDGATPILTQTVSERLRIAICEPGIDIGSATPLTVTASIGCTTAANTASAIDAARIAADISLYQAKKTGKNRVVLHQVAPAITASLLAVP